MGGTKIKKHTVAEFTTSTPLSSSSVAGSSSESDTNSKYYLGCGVHLNTYWVKVCPVGETFVAIAKHKGLNYYIFQLTNFSQSI